ncbi:hypothetical protein HELRODRAFT_161218 [Helobdella robusta]|uniref:Uncharacterized protein n=1 Tax=Helobdella robusta TaxID=6412 RepID=T1ER81_HELRO|nr:hypothetical protein HELRODRAFT_161218 [Helobdella robusta]ESO01999.1 hypothetical protein HELRODRAFT_161218 [Helobdella robusta]
MWITVNNNFLEHESKIDSNIEITSSAIETASQNSKSTSISYCTNDGYKRNKNNYGDVVTNKSLLAPIRRTKSIYKRYQSETESKEPENRRSFDSATILSVARNKLSNRDKQENYMHEKIDKKQIKDVLGIEESSVRLNRERSFPPPPPPPRSSPLKNESKPKKQQKNQYQQSQNQRQKQISKNSVFGCNIKPYGLVKQITSKDQRLKQNPEQTHNQQMQKKTVTLAPTKSKSQSTFHSLDLTKKELPSSSSTHLFSSYETNTFQEAEIKNYSTFPTASTTKEQQASCSNVLFHDNSDPPKVSFCQNSITVTFENPSLPIVSNANLIESMMVDGQCDCSTIYHKPLHLDNISFATLQHNRQRQFVQFPTSNAPLKLNKVDKVECTRFSKPQQCLKFKKQQHGQRENYISCDDIQRCLTEKDRIKDSEVSINYEKTCIQNTNRNRIDNGLRLNEYIIKNQSSKNALV